MTRNSSQTLLDIASDKNRGDESAMQAIRRSLALACQHVAINGAWKRHH
jgi:hypothetical protein